MKIFLIALFALLVALPVQARELCMVEKAYTGDTFICSDGVLMRLWGVLAPKIPPQVSKPEPKGEEAKDALEIYIKNKSLMCDLKDVNKNGKYYHCFMNKQDIGLKMLNDGLVIENTDQSDGYYADKLKPLPKLEENKTEVKQEDPSTTTDKPDENKPEVKQETPTTTTDKPDENKPEVKQETPSTTDKPDENRLEVNPETKPASDVVPGEVLPEAKPDAPVKDQ